MSLNKKDITKASYTTTLATTTFMSVVPGCTTDITLLSYLVQLGEIMQNLTPLTLNVILII